MEFNQLGEVLRRFDPWYANTLFSQLSRLKRRNELSQSPEENEALEINAAAATLDYIQPGTQGAQSLKKRDAVLALLEFLNEAYAKYQ